MSAPRRAPRHTWEPHEVWALRVLYPHFSAVEIADVLQLSVKHVLTKAKHLGLKKPREWFAERSRQHMAKPDHPGRKHHFRAGHPTWNADTRCTRRDYMPVHHLVWRMHGRTVPPGHVLVFRDGDARNFDINNLELLTRAQLMARNSVHRHGPEIAQLSQLLGAIKRQLNATTTPEPDHA